jgi:hypothetical protein
MAARPSGKGKRAQRIEPLVAGQPAGAPAPPKARRVEVMHPAWEQFMDFLVEGAITAWFKEQEERRLRGEPEPHAADHAAVDAAPGPDPDAPELISVDEAVLRFGMSREQVLAELEKHWEPFEVEIPAVGRRARSSQK